MSESLFPVRIRIVAIMLGLALLAPPTQAGVGGIEWRVAMLTGAQETPPVASAAFGGGVFVIDKCANTLSYYIVFQGLTETAAHIHGFAGPGAAAGVVHALPAGNPKIGVWAYTDAQEPSILAGLTYVNIHTAANPGGEIRGQIVTHVAELDGAQETPPVASAAGGWGAFNIDTVTNTLSYYIVFGGVAETAAHIHGYAAHGAPAGVVHPLPAGSPKVGVWNYPEANERQILDGMTYVNIHSAANPGGEIRGQIVPIVAPIDGMQEVPANVTPGAGVGLHSLNRAADVLGFDIRHGSLMGMETAAHIHGFAPRGASAGVIFPLPSPATRKLGTWVYGAANEANLLAGLTYINIHSTFDAAGEIRGQIEFPPHPCIADLDGDGSVGLADLAILLGSYGMSPAQYCDGDLDGDGAVGLGDLAILLGQFGLMCL